MRRSVVALLLGTMLGMAVPSFGQSNDELAKIRKEIEALKESQKALQQDLQDIKALLRARIPQPGAQGSQEAPAPPVALNVEGAPFLGNKDAKVTVVEFSDFQCAFCARHSQQTLPAIVKDYVEAGKVKYVLRDFPIAALHPQAHKSHEAAHCAGEQGKYWEMHARLFGNLRGQDPQSFTAHAKGLRLDTGKFDQCVASGRHAASVKKAIEEGQRAGVRGTPTFFVGPTGNGRTLEGARMIRGAQPYESFKSVIDPLLNGARPSQ